MSKTADTSPRDVPDAAGAARPRRRHRPREETRALLLDAATSVAIKRVADDGEQTHNALADIRIKDVLTEVNSAVGSNDGSRMTTGAFYQIWADQQDFQRELLAHVMERIATPGAHDIEILASRMIDSGESADEILRRVSEMDFRVSQQSPELFLALGLGALAPSELVRQAQVEANRRYIELLSDLLDRILRHGGRRLRKDRTIVDLIWATEALAVGYLLRSRTDPEVPEQVDEAGWSSHATAYVGIVHAFTETAESDG